MKNAFLIFSGILVGSCRKWRRHNYVFSGYRNISDQVLFRPVCNFK